MTATVHHLLAPRPRSGPLIDVSITAAAFAGTLLLLAHGAGDPPGRASGELDMIGILLAAGSTGPLIAWRRFPVGVFIVTSVAGAALAGLGYPFNLMLGSTLALYLLAASRTPKRPWTWRTTASLLAMFIVYLGATAVAQSAFPFHDLFGIGLAWAVAWFAGERTRLRHEQIAELKDRARHAEHDKERERLLAAAEERARIARDLHDSAGHAINVIAVRAVAARLRHHEEPDQSLRALEAIEEVARQTVEEIDHIVAALRDGVQANTVEAPIGLASLDTLIQQHQAAELDVSLEVSGTARRLGPAADQAAYRILQESLTNAARHGSGSVRIDLLFGNTDLEATVTNPIAARPSPPTDNGHGVIGMQERATLLGGSLDAGCADGVFRVKARIPYGDHPT